VDLYFAKLYYQVQPDSLLDEWVDIDFAELPLRPGMSGDAFVGDAGVTLVLATAGADHYLVDFTLTTLPPAATVVSRQIVLQRGQPLEILNLTYERRMQARVRISFHPYRGESECDFGTAEGARTVDEFISDIPFHGAPSMLVDSIDLSGEQIWYADPSAHFELFYIPNSLGDFAWNRVRDFLERDFKDFDNTFHLSRAQRVNYFIAPCRVPEIAWVPNRSWAIMPTTFKAYAIFNRDEKATSGVSTNMNHFYRYLGYAPMALVEGAARGFEYDHYYAKKLAWLGRLPRPSEHWKTIDYKAYPDSGLYIASGSLVSYLIATEGMPEFYRFYGLVDDLNPDSATHEIYGRSLRELEDGWLHFLDTMRVHPHMVMHFVGRAKALGRNTESIELLEVLIEVDTVETADAKDELALLLFLEGRYDEAVEVIGTMPDRYRNADRIRQMRHSALFFGGHVDSARAGWQGQLQDSVSSIFQSAISVMYGWLEMIEGNLELADSIFSERKTDFRGGVLDQIETDLRRATLLRTEGQTEEADSLVRLALGGTFELLRNRPGSGDLYLRVGEAYVQLGEPDTAFIYLDVAEFLEYRPYYVGRVLLAMGNAYDLLGMRDHAKLYYQRVLDSHTSYPARVEARRYLREPFRVNRTS
jgi:tetratricopeptide (TPR) repeat protein